MVSGIWLPSECTGCRSLDLICCSCFKRPRRRAQSVSTPVAASSSSAAAAKFLSISEGWCGSAWLHAANSANYRLSNAELGDAVALHLSLPIYNMRDLRCKCGRLLNPASIDLHAATCNTFQKTSRHEYLGAALDRIYVSLGAEVERAEGDVGGIGPQPYATILPPPTPSRPNPTPKHVYPDRYVKKLPKTSGRFVMDHTVVEPQASRHLPASAKTPGHAASEAHAAKVKLYTPILHPGDTLVIPAFETYGAVAKPFYDFLRGLAKAKATAAILEQYPRISEEKLVKKAAVLIAEIMRAWQIQLSFALLRGRLSTLRQVRSKLQKSVPRDSSHTPLTTVGLARFLGGRGVAAAYE